MGRWGYLALAALVTFVLASPASAARADARDDTAWLQARLDAGGNVFLPKLANGQCYATRGLWLSRDDTSVTSDGACIASLGLGEARLPGTPRPIRASAVFYLTHSDLRKPPPVRCLRSRTKSAGSMTRSRQLRRPLMRSQRNAICQAAQSLLLSSALS